MLLAKTFPKYYLSAMQDIDVQQHWRELREAYAQMNEDELGRVAADAFDLTPIAREALQAVISERGLKIQLAASPAPAEPSEIADSSDDELVCVRTLDSEAEAKEAKAILDANFIASCLGPENIVDLEDFKGSFEGGVDLKVFANDSRRASSVLSSYAPQEETAEELEAESKEYAVTCPKCRSEEVVFEGEVPNSDHQPAPAEFNWSCADCGHHWKDDGIAHVV